MKIDSSGSRSKCGYISIGILIGNVIAAALYFTTSSTFQSNNTRNFYPFSHTETNARGANKTKSDVYHLFKGENEKSLTTVTSQAQHKLVLFTTWIDKKDKRLIRDNLLRTWRLWKPSILPVIFSNEESVLAKAKEHDWETQPEVKTACGGVPIFREMFRTAMNSYDSLLYGYANGDLLLGKGLLDTVTSLAGEEMLTSKPVMVLVRRINVDFKNRPPVYNVDDLESIAKEGRPMTDGSSDAIFTNRLFPWDHVPDIVPGRIGIAMWMVSFARNLNVTVIDISNTTIAVHMTATKTGNSESWHHPHYNCNHQVFKSLNARPESFGCGLYYCASLKSARVKVDGITKIKMVDNRKFIPLKCSRCKMNMTNLMRQKF